MSQTVLVIKEETVLAVSGKEGMQPKIRRLEKEELTGYGDVMVRRKEAIEALGKRMNLSQVRLVLPASACATKIIQLPWVGKKELKAMALREMQEAFRSDIMDYEVIRSDKKNGILLFCVSVEETVLTPYLDLCAELKIEVKSITVPMEGLLRVLPRLENYQNRTAVYLFFEDGAVTSVLSETGEYKYSSRSRLFSEPGTLDFGTEIVRNVSGILQFHATSKSEHVITDVCYAGCPTDVFEVSRDGISNMHLAVSKIERVKGVTMPAENDFSEWMDCVGAMLNGVRKSHDIDLLSDYRKKSEKEENAVQSWQHVLPPVAVFLACALVYVGIGVWNMQLQREIDGIAGWMESDAVVKAYGEAQALDAEREKLMTAMNQVQKLNENRATYPKLSDTVVKKIETAGGDGITSNISGYNAETGEMTFEARSDTAIDIPTYISKLTETGLFYNVDYTGYVYENEAYTLSLLCMLEANETGGTKE